MQITEIVNHCIWLRSRGNCGGWEGGGGVIMALVDIIAIIGVLNTEQCSVFHCKVLDTAWCECKCWWWNFTGKSTVSHGDGSGWAILECSRETSSHHGRFHENTTWKRSCTGPADWEGAWGQWQSWGQELEGENGWNSQEYRNSNSPVPF